MYFHSILSNLRYLQNSSAHKTQEKQEVSGEKH